MPGTIVGRPEAVHDAFVLLAFVAGLVVSLVECRRRRMWDERLIPVLVGIVVGGALGARLAASLDALFTDGTSALALAWIYGGRSILGGLSGAYVGALIGKRVGGYPGRTGDLFAPATALALAIGRIGCFLTEPPGRPTDLPWGVRFDASATRISDCADCAAGVAMHPSFLYEVFFCLALFFALLWLRDRITTPGETFVVFLAAYALFRFGVEFTRANPPDLAGLTRSQLFILLLSPLLIWRVSSAYRRGVYDGALPVRRIPVEGVT